MQKRNTWERKIVHPDNNIVSESLSPKPKITLACSQFCAAFLLLARSAVSVVVFYFIISYFNATILVLLRSSIYDMVQHDIFILFAVLASVCPLSSPYVTFVECLTLQIMDAEQSPSERSKKRPASPELLQQLSSKKKQKVKYNRATVNLNQRISKAISEVIVTSLNDSFRDKCLQTLDVANGSEAGEKVEDLLAEFKGNQKQQKAIKENSQKINENSP